MGERRCRYLQVFAVEDTSVQVTWGGLGPGPVRFTAADTSREVLTDGGPGAVELEAQPADRAIEIALTGDGVPGGRRSLTTRTLVPPPGEECYRLATVSDLHVGAAAFGWHDKMVEAPSVTELHPVRCGRAALAQAEAWGADRIVVKGDMTHDGWPSQWEEVVELLAKVGLPVEVIPGNHDISSRRTVEPEDALAAHGIPLDRGVRSVELPGVRLVLSDTCWPGRHGGTIRALADDLIDALVDAARDGQPVLLALHHQFERFHHVPGWPPGIARHDGAPFLDRAALANPATFVTSGHTHRHRRHRHGPLALTQVGSTKDFPGVFGGYVVHEGGIRQVVRRVTGPECLPWTERTGDAVCRMWRFIAPGRLRDRCFTHPWP